MVLIRALAECTNSPSPLAMDDSLQLLLKGVAESEVRKSVEGAAMGSTAAEAAVASKVEMALFMAELRAEAPPPTEMAPDMGVSSPEQSDEDVAPFGVTSLEEGGEEGATLLLAFQRGASPSRDFSPREAIVPQKRRGVADRASHFFCKHPGCHKAYGCPDAVRKHCRKKHYEWLRRLDNAGPAGYCRWEQSD